MASKTHHEAGLDLKAARAWLRSKGHEIGDRGRLKEEHTTAYRAYLDTNPVVEPPK